MADLSKAVPTPPPEPPKQTATGTLTGAGVGGAFASILGWFLYLKWHVEMPNEVTAAFASAFTVAFAIMGNIADCIRWRRAYNDWKLHNTQFTAWLASQPKQGD